jgi:FRG domain
MALPGREVPVTSWNQLISELHSRKIVQLNPDEGDHLRSPYVFRGLDCANWDLETSLQRLPRKATTRPRVVERGLIRAFRKYASAGSFDERSEWYVLAVAQHNGLPTRCLDWTASPLVAAHFACGDEKYKNNDGVIWCLHAGILRDVNAQNNAQAASLRGVAWVYDTRLLEVTFKDVDDLDMSYSGGELMLLWEPPSLDSRIANQSGLLSIMNDGIASQDAFLQTHCALHPDLVVRIVISAGMKSEAREMLDQNNISERTIFPGLPGLCAWLKRYYGTAW